MDIETRLKELLENLDKSDPEYEARRTEVANLAMELLKVEKPTFLTPDTIISLKALRPGWEIDFEVDGRLAPKSLRLNFKKQGFVDVKIIEKSYEHEPYTKVHKRPTSDELILYESLSNDDEE